LALGLLIVGVFALSSDEPGRTMVLSTTSKSSDGSF